MAAIVNNSVALLAPFRPATTRNAAGNRAETSSLFLAMHWTRGGKSPSARELTSSPFLPCPRRRWLIAAVEVSESGSVTTNEDGKSAINKINIEDLPPVKALIQAYKKAMLEGDQKTIDEIEVAIYCLENVKNGLSMKFEEMTAEIASGKDRFLRLKADFENFRKQSDKDRATFTSDIRGDVIENLLSVVDSFEKTRQDVRPETEKEKNIETSYHGIYKQFVEVMRSMGVSVVETVGKPFDPAIHEAVSRKESQEFKAGIVSQEIHRGFLLGDQLLRTATVKVSTGPVQVKADSTVNGSDQPAEQVIDSTPDTGDS